MIKIYTRNFKYITELEVVCLFHEDLDEVDIMELVTE